MRQGSLRAGVGDQPPQCCICLVLGMGLELAVQQGVNSDELAALNKPMASRAMQTSVKKHSTVTIVPKKKYYRSQMVIYTN